jgi:cell division protein ZapA
MSNIRIDVLGTLFSIDTPADAAYMQFLLDNYKKMTALVEEGAGSNLRDPLQISIMSGIMLCDELYKEKKRNEKVRNDVNAAGDLVEAERLTLHLIEKLDKAVQ